MTSQTRRAYCHSYRLTLQVRNAIKLLAVSGWGAAPRRRREGCRLLAVALSAARLLADSNRTAATLPIFSPLCFDTLHPRSTQHAFLIVGLPPPRSIRIKSFVIYWQ